MGSQALRNLLNYRDLQGQGIHLTTTVVDGDEAIELRRNGEILALVKRSTNGLYSVKINCWHHETQSRLQANTVSSHPYPSSHDQVPAGCDELRSLIESKAATLRLVDLMAATLAKPKAATMIEHMATILSKTMLQMLHFTRTFLPSLDSGMVASATPALLYYGG